MSPSKQRYSTSGSSAGREPYSPSEAGRAGGNLYLKGSDFLLPDEPRLSVLWRAKWRIALCALIAAVVAAVVALLPQTQYSAQATVRISLLSAKGVPREIVLAQNDLAAQYALLATSAPVLAAAEALAGGPVGTVEATPINAYNIVGITATSSDSKTAARRADAVAQALVTYVKTSDAEAAAAAAKVIEPQLKQLDEQIEDAQDAVTKLQSQLSKSNNGGSGTLQALLNSQLSLLGTLVANRSNIFTSATRDAAAAAPQLTLLDRPTEGEPEPKHALVYALVAFLLTALATGEISVLLFRLRTLSQTGQGLRGERSRGSSTGAQRRPDENDRQTSLVFDGSGHS